MAVITISRQFGAGEELLGRAIADQLGYTFADRDIIQMIAREANVSTNWVESFEKEAGSRISRMISKLVSHRGIERVLQDEYGYLDENIYLDYLVLIIARAADEGNVVIMGRGSQYILNDHPETRHILLIDAFENRVKAVMKQYRLSQKRAARIVSNEDRRRENLYRRLGKKDYDNPSLYHMVLNTSRVDHSAAVSAVCSLIG
jgi:cytidylate kinase